MRFPRVLAACAVAVSLVVVAGGARAVAAPGSGGATPSPAQSGPLDGITGTIGGLLGGGSGDDGSPSPTPTSSSSTHRSGPGDGGSGGAGGSGTSPVSGLPLPKPGDNVPDHLCLPEQLASSLPADLPTCLDLTTCKAGLIRDLERLPTVKLTELADYVQQVLGDIPACLESLLPSPSPSPSTSTPTATPTSKPPAPAPVEHEPAPAQPATPVTRQPAFTG